MSVISKDLKTTHHFELVQGGSALDIYRCKTCLLSWNKDAADQLEGKSCSLNGM